MITHILAMKLMLFATPLVQMMEVVGHEPEHHSTKFYNLELTDQFGETYCIHLIRIDKISTNPGPCNLDVAYEVFPHIDDAATDKLTGPVDILK